MMRLLFPPLHPNRAVDDIFRISIELVVVIIVGGIQAGKSKPFGSQVRGSPRIDVRLSLRLFMS